MKLFTALLKGVRQGFRAWPVVLVVFGVNLVLAGVTALLFKSSLTSALGNTLTANEFLDGFSFTYYMDLIKQNPGLFRTLLSFVVWLVVIHNLLSVFFDGGIIVSVNAQTENVSLQSFFAGCGQFVGRFFRLFLLMAAIGVVLILILGVGAGFLFSIIQGEGETEVQIFRAVGIVGAFIVFPFSIFLLIADYSRVLIVEENTTKVIRSFGRSTGFVIRHFLSVYSLSLMLFIGYVLLFLSTILIELHLGAENGLILFGIFLLQQVVVLARAWWRIAGIGSQVALFDAFKPEPKQEVVPESENIGIATPIQHDIPVPAVSQPIVEPQPLERPIRKRVVRKKIVSGKKKTISRRTGKKQIRK